VLTNRRPQTTDHGPLGAGTRQRPGTAKDFVFLNIEDETGIANAIVTPTFSDRTNGS